MTSDRASYVAPLRSVLVPLDGSPLAEQAIPVAAALAKGTGAKLHFATVEPPLSLMVMTAPEEGGVPVPGLHDLQLQVRGQWRAYLASKAEEVRTTHGVRAATRVLAGQSAPALAAYADSHEIDLVVMTTHGRGGISRFWLGSVADQLLRRTAVPVLLLRPQESTIPPQFHCVLVALDGSAQSEEAIAPALTLARTTPGSRVILAQVIEPGLPLVGPEYQEMERRDAAGKLEHLAQRLRRHGIAATAQVTTGAGIAAEIHRLARREEVDLIVIGTHGARGVERLLLGSVADKVVRGATQPVLVVPRRPKAAGWDLAPVEDARTVARSAAQ